MHNEKDVCPAFKKREDYKVQVMDSAWSIDEPMCPYSPLVCFCFKELKNIANTADFFLWAICPPHLGKLVL